MSNANADLVNAPNRGLLPDAESDGGVCSDGAVGFALKWPTSAFMPNPCSPGARSGGGTNRNPPTPHSETSLACRKAVARERQQGRKAELLLLHCDGIGVSCSRFPWRVMPALVVGERPSDRARAAGGRMIGEHDTKSADGDHRSLLHQPVTSYSASIGIGAASLRGARHAKRDDLGALGV